MGHDYLGCFLVGQCISQDSPNRTNRRHSIGDIGKDIGGLPRWASQVALVVKSFPANTGDIGGTSSVPRSGRSPGGGCGNPL